jgi:hypothetical protein
MKKHCLDCGTDLKDKRSGAKFCSLECKNHYNYKSRENSLSGVTGITPKPEFNQNEKKEESATDLELSLRGIVEYETEKPSHFNKERTVDTDFFNDMFEEGMVAKKILPLRNVIDESKFEEKEIGVNGNQEAEEAEGDDEDTDEKKLLPQNYITKSFNELSPLYTQDKAVIDFFEKKKQNLQAEYKKLEGEYKTQQTRNGNKIIATAGIGGALLGVLKDMPAPELNLGGTMLRAKKGKLLLRSTKNKKWEQPNKEDSFWEKFGAALLFGAIGTGVGVLAKGMSNDWREQDKKERMEKIKKRMTQINKEYWDAQKQIDSGKNLLALIPEKISKTVSVPGPDFTLSLSGVSRSEAEPEAKKIDMKKRNQASIKFKSDKIVKASELAKRNYKSLGFKGLWKGFFGLPSVNFHILIHGNSGEGKSTFCLWFAKYLAENFGRVLYVSGEEGDNKTFRDKLKYCKAEVDGLHILDVRTGNEFMEEVGEHEFHFIILDSLHDMEIDARKMKEIFQRYKQSAFICIDQNNKKGELLGANEKKHICDVVVNVKNYAAETTKNRFKEKGIIFPTADFNGKDGTKAILIKKSGGNGKDYHLDSDRKGLI